MRESMLRIGHWGKVRLFLRFCSCNYVIRVVLLYKSNY